MQKISIDPERPDTADARLLIAELEASLTPQYPPADSCCWAVYGDSLSAFYENRIAKAAFPGHAAQGSRWESIRKIIPDRFRGGTGGWVWPERRI